MSGWDGYTQSLTYSTAPDRQVRKRPVYYHVDGDFDVHAHAFQDRFVGRDYYRSIPMADVIGRLIQGFVMLVPMPDLLIKIRRHALSSMCFTKMVVHLECVTANPKGRRRLRKY